MVSPNLGKGFWYPRYPVWERRRRVLNRIKAYHKQARNTLSDRARKIPCEIVVTVKELGYTVAREDLTGLKEFLRELPKSIEPGYY